MGVRVLYNTDSVVRSLILPGGMGKDRFLYKKEHLVTWMEALMGPGIAEHVEHETGISDAALEIFFAPYKYRDEQKSKQCEQ